MGKAFKRVADRAAVQHRSPRKSFTAMIHCIVSMQLELNKFLQEGQHDLPEGLLEEMRGFELNVKEFLR